MILTGDCVELMAGMDAGSVDAIVCDPPAGIGFMGKEWDDFRRARNPADVGRDNVFGRTSARAPEAGRRSRAAFVEWMTVVMSECYRVLKPGHWALVWSLPRTSHWTAWAIEDAGFRLTDVLMHCFAQGFPKGRGQLKPAYEPWILARKPGLAAPLQIDAARIPGTKPIVTAIDSDLRDKRILHTRSATGTGEMSDVGRWPANVVLTDPIFDGGWDGVVGGGAVDAGIAVRRNVGRSRRGQIFGTPDAPEGTPEADFGYGDTGTYSRFFLVPKASRSDREPNAYGRMVGGLEETAEPFLSGRLSDPCMARPQLRKPRLNLHATVKPLELMRHLVRLVTPPGGTVLDPFAGSGTTLLAAEMEGFPWIGIEKEPEYVAIIEARLAGVQRGMGLDVAAPTAERKTTGRQGPDKWNRVVPKFQGTYHEWFGESPTEAALPEDDVA